MIIEKKVKILYWTDGDYSFEVVALLEILNRLSNYPINFPAAAVEYLKKKDLIEYSVFGGWAAKNENSIQFFLEEITNARSEYLETKFREQVSE